MRLRRQMGPRLAAGAMLCVATVTGLSGDLARAENAPAPRATFVATELLGRPTDNSITVNVVALEDLDAYFEYGTQTGTYTDQTATTLYPGGDPIEAVMDQLQPDTRYYYRMRYRQPGEPTFGAGDEHSFHTQRPRGSAFVFAVQSDSHLPSANQDTLDLYQRTLLNLQADNPDLLLDLGDTFLNGSAGSYQQALDNVLVQRPYLGLVCHSVPLFLATGNHDGELGWKLDGTANNTAVWATNARKQLFPNPFPDGFYTGGSAVEDFVGVRESYYAWEWGDALFVVLDPYWYTTTKPHHPNSGGSGDRWDWTLGLEQYTWLRQTLEQSDANLKFVFSHHVTGGWTDYGRGGIEAASHALGQDGSYEWGGENQDGTWGFDDRRPGWNTPIHQLMVENGVAVYFHGHDHVFVKQDLDGVVYQECPKPSNATYNSGKSLTGGYVNGDIVPNSGHVRVAVSATEVTVDYVRAYLPQDEGPGAINGQVAYTYTVNVDCNGNGLADYLDIAGGTSADVNGNRVPDECESGGSGDLDGDGDVDLNDFATLATCFGAIVANPPPACTAEDAQRSDLDGNGVVNLNDFASFALNFGS